jgi:hypothetical protein
MVKSTACTSIISVSHNFGFAGRNAIYSPITSVFICSSSSSSIDKPAAESLVLYLKPRDQGTVGLHQVKWARWRRELSALTMRCWYHCHRVQCTSSISMSTSTSMCLLWGHQQLAHFYTTVRSLGSHVKRGFLLLQNLFPPSRLKHRWWTWIFIIYSANFYVDSPLPTVVHFAANYVNISTPLLHKFVIFVVWNYCHFLFGYQYLIVFVSRVAA